MFSSQIRGIPTGLSGVTKTKVFNNILCNLGVQALKPSNWCSNRCIRLSPTLFDCLGKSVATFLIFTFLLLIILTHFYEERFKPRKSDSQILQVRVKSFNLWCSVVWDASTAICNRSFLSIENILRLRKKSYSYNWQVNVQRVSEEKHRRLKISSIRHFC